MEKDIENARLYTNNALLYTKKCNAVHKQLAKNCILLIKSCS